MVRSCFVYFILTAVLVTVSSTNVQKIRLQSKSNNNIVLYTHPNKTTSVRIYSNQLNDQILDNLFTTRKINQEVILTDKFKGRQSICSSLKYCEETSDDQKYCSLVLNIVFYTSISRLFQRTTRHYSQIDSVKLNIIVSDFTSDSLNFKKSDYNFQLNSKSVRLASSDKLSLGMIKAELTYNADFNSAIQYYLDFNTDTKAEYISLFNLDSTTGQLTLNKKNFEADENNFNKEFVFFVDAQVQCASESPLKRRTTVRVYVVNLNGTNMQVTDLVDTKILTDSYKCIKLTNREFELDTKLALTQVILNKKFTETELKDLQLIKIKPELSQLTSDNFKIERVIDNIYVIYLVNARSYKNLFINDIYNIRFKFGTSTLDMHVCIDTTLTNNSPLTDLGLVQFKENLIRLNTPVNVRKSNIESKIDQSGFIDLHAFNLDTSRSLNRLNFELNDEQVNSAPFKLNLHAISNKPGSTRLGYKKMEVYENKIEQLQYEIDAVVYDPSLLDSKDSTNAFHSLQQLAIKNNKFVRSICKVLINKNVETIVDDMSHPVSESETGVVHKFRVRPEGMVKSSVVGYLPNIHDLEMSQALTFDRLRSPAESFYYELEKESTCFRLNKFDGVLTLVDPEQGALNNKSCIGEIREPIKLKVLIKSMNDLSVLIEYGEIWLYHILDISSKQDISFLEINSNSVNLIYENKEDEDLIKNHQITNEFGINFVLNKTSFESTSSLPEFIRLVDLISYFQPTKKSAEDFKTQFEIINDQSNLFVMDSKKNAIYLSLSQKIQHTCYSLSLTANNYLYTSSIRRKMLSADSFKLNICFLDQPGFNLNVTAGFRSFVTPIFIENDVTFEQLSAKSTRHTIINISVFVACFSLVCLVLVIVFLARKSTRQDEEKTKEDKNLEANLSTVYSVSVISGTNESIDTTSTKSSRLEQGNGLDRLKIRNDLSYNQTYYEQVNHDELFSEASDQGVYCLATGTSFSLTSNISSVTSQLVDSEDIDQLNSSGKSSMISVVNDLVNEQTNMTKLSLFDLTPKPLRLENVIDFRQSMDSGMKTWVYSNYLSNCVEKRREKISLSDENESLDSIEFSSECII